MTLINKKNLLRVLYDVHHIQITSILPFFNKISHIRIYKLFILLFLFLTHIGIFLKSKTFICISNLDLVLTTKCTLKCKDCSNLMPYYKDALTYRPEELIKDLDVLLSAVDLIYEMRLIGGELLLYPQLGKIISKCLAERKIKKIRIITNGTLMPSEDCLDLLSRLNSQQKKKIIFFISSYSVVADAIKNKLSACLKNMGFCVYVSGQEVWCDEGLFDQRDFSIVDLEKNYSRCSLCTTLFNHEVSVCSRSAHGTFLGLIPKVETEHVKLSAGGSKELREQLQALFNKKFISTCNYCDNMKNIKIPAAIQLDTKSGAS